MPYNLRRCAIEQAGQAVIGLVALIALVAVLGVIATTSFTTTKTASGDGSAKNLARAAQGEAQSVAAAHHGSYATVGLLRLHRDNPAIVIQRSGSVAWLSAATGDANSFSVTATAEPSANTYTVTRLSGGQVSRTCTVAANSAAAGCRNGTW